MVGLLVSRVDPLVCLARRQRGCCIGGARTWADGKTDVDEAVRAQERDPTGGRGVNGKISNQLEGARGRETLESAV